MKKILSLALAGVMAFSMIPAAFAAEITDEWTQNTNADEYNLGTAVAYDAEDPDGDGVVNNQEAYTVTVPATMAPGDTGYVVAEGTWASNRQLVVSLVPNPDTQKQTVTLANSINTADTKELALTFDGITLVGSNTASVTNVDATNAPKGTAISVEDISDALFGTWEGVFNYNVEMQNVA